MARSHDQYYIPGCPYPQFLPNWESWCTWCIGPSPPQKVFKHLGVNIWPLRGFNKPGVDFFKIWTCSPEMFKKLISTTGCGTQRIVRISLAFCPYDSLTNPLCRWPRRDSSPIATFPSIPLAPHSTLSLFKCPIAKTPSHHPNSLLLAELPTARTPSCHPNILYCTIQLRGRRHQDRLFNEALVLSNNVGR